MMNKSGMKIKFISISILLILTFLLIIFIVVADSTAYELIYAEDLTFSNTESLDEGDAYGEFDDVEAEIASTLPANKWSDNCFVDAVIENTGNYSYTFISLNFSVRISFPGTGWKSKNPDYFGIQYSLDEGSSWSSDVDTFQTVSSLTTFGPYTTTASSWNEVNQTRIRIVYYKIGTSDGITTPLYIDGYKNNITYMVPNFLPELSNPSPSNGAINVEPNPSLRIDVSDDNGHQMDLSFHTNSSGLWQCIGGNHSVNDGTYSQIDINMSEYDTKYWWSVNCTDGIGWTNQTHYFTTTSFVSIYINQSVYAFPGIKQLNSVYYTNETNNEYFGIFNDGGAAVDLEIYANDMSCSHLHSWTLGTSNGPNQYSLEYSEDGGSTWHSITTTPNTFYSNLGIGSHITLDLRITMPTSVSCGHEMECTVYVDAIAH